MRHWGAALLAAIVMFGNVDPAAAACAQRDIVGDWDLYFTLDDGTGLQVWLSCSLQILAGGSVRPGPRCLSGRPGFTLPVVGGRLAVDQSCIVSGALNLRTGGRTFPLRVQRATMAPGKDVFLGVGIDPPAGQITVNAVRR
jgi:hypothetical protein